MSAFNLTKNKNFTNIVGIWGDIMQISILYSYYPDSFYI